MQSIINACSSLSHSNHVCSSYLHPSFHVIFFIQPLKQTEINTHLNVLHINLNNNYDNSATTSDALHYMRNTFGRTSSVGWHYTSSTGVKPDLHHALLSKNMGGGIAYVGVICDSDYGFGLSASLSGNYVSMGNAVVWDMMVVGCLD